MNEDPSIQRDEARREFAKLKLDLAEAGAMLKSLRLDIAQANTELAQNDAATLLAANEQLALGMLGARAELETASAELDEASRSAALDYLTDLPNRMLLLDRLGQGIASAKRHGSSLALLFIDLNHFKHINDTLGHSAGDEVLKVVASCLLTAVRSTDAVSRHGGDEFLVVLTDILKASEAVQVANKITALLGAPHSVHQHVLRLTASIGIGIYPDHASEAGPLIECADAAMYQAKGEGLSVRLFDNSAKLRSPNPASPRPAPVSHVIMPIAEALAERDRLLVVLQEANERLVMSLLDAKELHGAAEQVRKRQSEFLAVVVHEMRNPLAPLRAAAALLPKNSTDPVSMTRLQTIIERQVRHLTRMIDDLVCRRRFKSDPPRRSNIDSGMDADRVMVGCGQV